MTIRSMPPASSHLADRPGAGAAADDRLAARDHVAEAFEDFARRSACLNLPCRLPALRRPAAVQRPEGSHQFGGERRIVDVVRQADQLAHRGLPHRRLERCEQRLVRRRIVERLARRIEHRDAAFGQEEAHRRGPSG
jgi:hypothetical protein